MPYFKIGNTVPSDVTVGDAHAKVVGCGDTAVWAKFDEPTTAMPSVFNYDMVTGFEYDLTPVVYNMGITRVTHDRKLNLKNYKIQVVTYIERNISSISAILRWTFIVNLINTSTNAIVLVDTFSYSESGMWDSHGRIDTARKHIKVNLIGANNSTVAANEFKCSVEITNPATSTTIGTCIFPSSSRFNKIASYTNGYPKLENEIIDETKELSTTLSIARLV